MFSDNNREESSLKVKAKNIAHSVFRHENSILGGVLVALIAAIAGITKGLTIQPVNVTNVILQSSIRGVASIGQALVILSGGIDLSVGGIGLMCSILGTSMMTQAAWLNIVGHPVPVYVAIPVMLLVGACWGIINGLAISRTGMPPLIVTLSIWEITKGVSFQISGGVSIFEQPQNLSFWGSGTIGGIPVPIIIFIVVAIVAYIVMHHTTFGRSVYAVGGNRVSSWLSGIRVKNVIFTVYIISGFLAGLAGVILTARIMSASIRSLAGLELDSIAAVCVGGVSLAGGKGNIVGVVLGVLMIGVINNVMSVLGIGPAVQGIAKGLIIFTAVLIDYLRRGR